MLGCNVRGLEVPSVLSFEFKTNHEEWIKTVKPKLGSDVSDDIHAAISATHNNIKVYYKVRTEMRAALRSVLKHEEYPIRVSFIAFHGSDKFLLDTVLDMYQSLQGHVSDVTSLPPSLDLNGNMEASALLKEKGNVAYKGRQWNRVVSYYTEAINLDESNATFYCNRAVAYLELGCFQQAKEDCNKAISLDKKALSHSKCIITSPHEGIKTIILEAVKKEDAIFVGQYLFTGSETTSVWLEVDKVEGDDVDCKIKNTVTLAGALFTLHASQIHIDLPTLTEKDKERLGGSNKIDFLSLSYTRHAQDVRELLAREYLSKLGDLRQIQIFAKIENIEASVNFFRWSCWIRRVH